MKFLNRLFKLLIVTMILIISVNVLAFFDFRIPSLQDIFLNSTDITLYSVSKSELITYKNKQGETVITDITHVCELSDLGYITYNLSDNAIELCFN